MIVFPAGHAQWVYCFLCLLLHFHVAFIAYFYHLLLAPSTVGILHTQLDLCSLVSRTMYTIKTLFTSTLNTRYLKRQMMAYTDIVRLVTFTIFW